MNNTKTYVASVAMHSAAPGLGLQARPNGRKTWIVPPKGWRWPFVANYAIERPYHDPRHKQYPPKKDG